MDEAGKPSARLEHPAVVLRNHRQSVPQHPPDAVVDGRQARSSPANHQLAGRPDRPRRGLAARPAPVAGRHRQIEDRPRSRAAAPGRRPDHGGVRMSMEPIVHRIKVALDVAPADPGLRAREISSLPLDRRQAHRARLAWAGPVAVVLAVAVVAGLISVGAFRARAPSYSGTVDVGDCRLPVYGTAKGPARPGLYEEGFLNLSTGEFMPATPPSTVQTDQVVSPIGWFGANRGISYDPVVDQWLPVPLAWIAPDGLSYAYLTGSVAM